MSERGRWPCATRQTRMDKAIREVVASWVDEVTRASLNRVVPQRPLPLHFRAALNKLPVPKRDDDARPDRDPS